MDQPHVAQPHGGVSLGLQREGIPSTRRSVGEPRGHYAEGGEPVTKRRKWSDSTYVTFREEPESEGRKRNGGRRGWGGGATGC